MLFDVLNSRIIDVDLPLIVGNTTVLHEDEYPMLFYGTNRLSNIVVGSVMCEDDEEDIIRHLHVIISDYELKRFIKRNISYRELIEAQPMVFLLDKTESGDIITTYYLPISEIPSDYLPHPHPL